MTVLVHVNDFSCLVEDSSVRAVEALILDAVHDGGAFIDVPSMAAQPVRVLVTGSSAVHIARVPAQVEPSDSEDLFPDFDSYGLEI